MIVALAQGEVEIEGADPLRTLDAIVALDHDMGFIALGRAEREPDQPHDQVIAVGFDRAGEPTWTRVLEHLRAVEIYGGTITTASPASRTSSPGSRSAESPRARSLGSRSRPASTASS